MVWDVGVEGARGMREGQAFGGGVGKSPKFPAFTETKSLLSFLSPATATVGSP